MKRKIFANKTKAFRSLFFTGIGISLTGVAVAVAGGVFIEIYGEDTVWANAVFGCGMAFLLLGIVPVLFANFADRRKQRALTAEESRAISEDAYACPLGILVFSETGVEIRSHGNSPFSEYNESVPYKEVLLYRTCVRKKPQEAGKEVILLRMSANYFIKREFGDEEEDPAEFAVLEIEERERFLHTVEKYGIKITDCRIPPVSSPVLVRKIRFSSGRKLRIAILSAMLLVIMGVGIGLGVWLGGIYENATSFVTPACSGLCVVAVLSQSHKLKENGPGLKLRIFKSGMQFSAGLHRCYFPWEEIEQIQLTEMNRKTFLLLQSPYAQISVPEKEGLYEYFRKEFPEKCKETNQETAA